MTVQPSRRLEESFPYFRELLTEVAGHSRSVDRDIRTRDLLVEARVRKEPGIYNGWAYPEIWSKSRGVTRFHSNGRILLCIGEQVPEADVMSLFAHELRHIGQFHRGRRRFGYLNADYMADCEADAIDFEDRILNRMGVA